MEDTENSGISSIARSIRSRRMALGLRQKELAVQLGISASYLNLIESGQRVMPHALRLRLAEALQMAPQLLRVSAVSRLEESLSDEDFVGLAAFVAQFPEVARRFVEVKAALAQSEQARALWQELVQHDLTVAAQLHRVVDLASSLQATASLLQEELEGPWRARFLENLRADAAALAQNAQALHLHLERPMPAEDAPAVPDLSTLSQGSMEARWAALAWENPAVSIVKLDQAGAVLWAHLGQGQSLSLHLCPFWPAFAALHQCDQPIERVLRMAGEGKVYYAQAIARQLPDGRREAVMLMMPSLSWPEGVVGPGCRRCVLKDCAARRA